MTMQLQFSRLFVGLLFGVWVTASVSASNENQSGSEAKKGKFMGPL